MILTPCFQRAALSLRVRGIFKTEAILGVLECTDVPTISFRKLSSSLSEVICVVQKFLSSNTSPPVAVVSDRRTLESIVVEMGMIVPSASPTLKTPIC